MQVYRKPATAEWYDNSTKLVDNFPVTVEPWTGALSITFDATKDKSGERHTTMSISLDEKDVESLYNRLTQGRKNELRETQREVKKLVNKMENVYDKIASHQDKLYEQWLQSRANSDEEAVWEKLKTPIEKLLEQRYIS